jgi:hypothetical protein
LASAVKVAGQKERQRNEGGQPMPPAAEVALWRCASHVCHASQHLELHVPMCCYLAYVRTYVGGEVWLFCWCAPRALGRLICCQTIRVRQVSIVLNNLAPASVARPPQGFSAAARGRGGVAVVGGHRQPSLVQCSCARAAAHHGGCRRAHGQLHCALGPAARCVWAPPVDVY